MEQIEPSYKNTISLPLMLPQVTMTNAIVPLQPQPDNLNSRWERLITVVQHINQMAIELEAKMLELKTIASAINSQLNSLTENNQQSNLNICQYSPVSVPVVKQNSDKSFILTTRKVDLFKAEREAAQLAQQLRQLTYRKKNTLNKSKKTRH